MSLGERDQASGSQARHPRADTSSHDAVADSTPPATAERIHTRHSDREIRSDDIDDKKLSFSSSARPSLRDYAHHTPSATAEVMTTVPSKASGAAPHRAETSVGELAPDSAQNSSSHRASKGLSPSSRSTQSQTPRAGSSASSSTIVGLHDLRTGPSAPPPMLTGLPQHSLKDRTYKLIIRQQPQQGRLCGLGSKDKRPLDPLPILQLRILKSDGTEDEDAENSPNLILQVSLRKQDMATGTHVESVLVESNATAHPFTRMLEGRLVASANVARDLDGSRACFFVFTDLSIRQEGHFRLAFKLIALGPGDPSSPGGQVLAEALTEPFAIYSPRRFPGMTESTELAKCLARQGIQVPVRNDVRRRQEQADSDDREND